MLTLQNVHAHYRTVHGEVSAVDGVSLTVHENEILGIAGESGCGKSSLLKVLYGYIEPPLMLESGELHAETEVDGQLVRYDATTLRNAWWRFISYVPQGSMSVLSPVTRIDKQFFDAVTRSHSAKDKAQVQTQIEQYLKELELPVEVLRSYPHQLSGGMRQRVLVALATFLHPRIILADEPTTALDVVVQRGILTMLMRVQERNRSSLVLVSHDMGVHYQITHRMAIMYAGKVVETGPTNDIFTNPLHPYTQMLVDSLPRIGDVGQRKGIAGRPPSLLNPPQRCRFADRCPHAMDVCREHTPPLTEVKPGHFAACFLHDAVVAEHERNTTTEGTA